MESSNNINATMSDANEIRVKLKNSIDGRQKISAKLGNDKIQLTENPYGVLGKDTRMIQYEYLHDVKNSSGRKKLAHSITVKKHNPAMAGYDGYRYPATYSIDGVNASRDEYRQTNANMKDLMDPENFIKVVNNGIENSNKQNLELLFSIHKAIQRSSGKYLPSGMMKEVFKYAKPDAVENTQNRNNAINDTLVKKIHRKRETRGNACNQCTIC
jgi:hypothetical protein